MSDPVHERFVQYSSFGDKTSAGLMDGNMFAKMAKETNLINKTCTKTDIDLVFTRAKVKGQRKIDWRGFSDACIFIAEKRFPKIWKEQGRDAALHEVHQLIAAAPGPQANATKADYVKFHDDKSTYTGVYAKGGPTNVDSKITLSNLADRSPANARGMKQ